MKSTTLFRIAGEVMTIATRYGIAMDDQAADPAAIIERVREEIFERGRSYRDDLRRLRRLADELATDGEDDRGGDGVSNAVGNGAAAEEGVS